MVVIARVVVAVLAVGVLAWFAILERDVRLQASAATTGNRDPVTADRQLRQSKLLRPGSGPDLDRAVLAARYKRYGRARELAGEAVRSEPANVQAWLDLLFFTRGRDPAGERRATQTLERLDPLSASTPVLAPPARRR